MNTFQLTIKADYFCEVYLDSVLIAVATVNEPLCLNVISGEHNIKCVCTTDEGIYIDKNINVSEDKSLQISFEDYIFEHPECIQTINQFSCFELHFPRLAKAWEDIDCLECFTEPEDGIPEHICVKKNGVHGYVNVLGEEDLEAYYEITENGKYGFARGLGQVVIPCIYDLPEWSILSDDERLALEESDYEHYLRIIHEPTEMIFRDSSIGIVHLNDKWGFIDLKTEVQTPITYERIGLLPLSYEKNELIPVMKDGFWGVFNKFKMTEVIECKYNDIDVRYGVVYCEQEDYKKNKYHGVVTSIHDIIYTLDGHKGLFDLSGRQLTPAIYDKIERYCNGMARVSRNGKWGFINELGVEVIACEYDKAGDFNDGIAGVRKGEKWGIINNEGHIIYPFELDFCCWSVQGYAIINIAGKSGVINNFGQIIIPCEYDKISPDTWDEFDSTESPFEWLDFIDEDTGERICDDRSCQSWDYNIYNYFIFEKHGNWGAFNLEGKMILPYIYTYFKSFGQHLIGIRETDKKVYLSSTYVGFSNEEHVLLNEKYILIKNDNKWKLYNTSGELALGDEFDSYHSYINYETDLLAVKKGDKYAIVNLKTGKYTTPFEYNKIYEFYEGRATVERNGLNGYIDENGKEVIPCKYKEAWMFKAGTAEVEFADSIDKYGNHIG